RSEFWFAVAERADTGQLDLSRLSQASLSLLRRQVMAPTYRLDSQGRRVVEPKSDTKRRIGRSPDDADALNLAFGTGLPPFRIASERLQPSFRFHGRPRSRVCCKTLPNALIVFLFP